MRKTGTQSNTPDLSTSPSYIKAKGGYDGRPLLQRYAYKITDAVKQTIKGSVKDDPVALQYIPQKDELKILPEEHVDPIGDARHTPLKGLVHRYPDRVLLKLSNVCAVYCRYCFRREMVGPGEGVLSDQDIQMALDYIRSDKNIWEVILTGGDPLILSPRKLKNVLDQLEAIEHVQVIRIHTRLPIAAPEKITGGLGEVLARKTPVYMALHVNHANEITLDVKAALETLSAAGCILLSQSVLLKGVNDNAHTLEDLFRRLIASRVKPYYLHHPDLAPGTSHFRLSIKEGQSIIKKLQGRVSGICLPAYMLDIPGGDGKVPINPCYIKQLDEDTYSIENFEGHQHIYPPKGSAS